LPKEAGDGMRVVLGLCEICEILVKRAQNVG